MTYKSFLSRIRRENISSFYLFEGEEEYLKKEVLCKLKKKLISGNEDFNYRVLNASYHKGREILESAYQLPFNSKWQLLVVEEAEKLTGNDEREVMNYLKKPVDSTCMVLVGNNFNKQSNLYNFFKKNDRIVSFYPLSEVQIVEWIKEKVREGGKDIGDEAAFELYRRIGKDLFLLQGEIDKLLSFVHPHKFIEESDVAKLTGEKSQESIFDFLKAFKEKKLSRTLYILARLLSRGEEPLMVSSMLAREVRILLLLKLSRKELTPLEACSYIFKTRRKYTGFFLEKASEYINASKKFTLPQLLFAQQKMLDVELSIKSGKEKADIAIEKVVISILSFPLKTFESSFLTL